MNIRTSLAALVLGLASTMAFAATPEPAKPAATEITKPAATETTKHAATETTKHHTNKHRHALKHTNRHRHALKCKAGQKVVKGKCKATITN